MQKEKPNMLAQIFEEFDPQIFGPVGPELTGEDGA